MTISDAAYEQHCRDLARVLQDYLEQYPEDAGCPITNEYDFARFGAEHDLGQDAEVLIPLMEAYRTAEGITERMERKAPELRRRLSELTMTGYQIGVAYDLAHAALGLYPGRENPALLDLL